MTCSHNDVDSPTKRLLERLESVARKRLPPHHILDDLYTEGFESGVKEMKEYLEECLYLYNQDVVLFSTH